MALSIINSPDDRLHRANEHCVVVFETDDMVASAGVVEKISLTFSGVATSGQTLTLTINGQDLEFIARSTLLEDGKDWEIGSSASDQRSKAATALEKNLVLMKDFYLEAVSSTVFNIVAKEAGSAFDISYSNSMTGLAIASVADGDDTGYHDFHKLYTALWGHNSNGADPSPTTRPDMEEAYPFDSNGLCEVDLRKIANAYIERKLTWPADENIYQHRESACKLILKAAAQYGTPPVPESDMLSIERWFVGGGLSFEKVSEMNEGGNAPFLASGTTLLPFLTDMPDNKPVVFEQPEKLFYFGYHYQVLGYLKLYFNIIKTDGTTISDKLQAWFPGYYKETVHELCVGAYFLNLTNYADIEDIDQYQVYLKDSFGTLLSETFTFKLDHRYYENRRYFAFASSAGGFDVVGCFGITEQNLEYERKDAELIATHDHTTDNASSESYQVIEQQTFKTSTGWLRFSTRADVLEWLRDLALSTLVYELQANYKRRVKLTSSKIFKKRDNEYEYKFDFEYQPAFSDEHWYPVEDRRLLDGVGWYFPHTYDTNVPDVRGIVWDGEGDERMFSFGGELMNDGDRFLLIDRSTKVGVIVSYNEDAGTLDDTYETVYGNRVYNLYDGKVYQCNADNAWLDNLIIDSVTERTDDWEIQGKLVGNSTIKVFSADTHGAPESEWTEVDVDYWSVADDHFTLRVRKLKDESLNTIHEIFHLRVQHCQYQYEPHHEGADLSVELTDLGLSSYNNFSISENGEADGAVLTSVSGGTGPYTFLWSDDSTLAQITYVRAGDYWVVVTDQNGNSVKREITLNEPSELTYSAVVTPPTSQGGNDGSIYLQAVGGAGGYSYLWQSGSTEQERTNLSAGTYRVEAITDQNGAAIENIDITVEDGPA